MTCHISHYIFSFLGIDSVSLKTASIGAMSLQVISFTMSFTFSKVLVLTSFLILINCITCVLTAFHVNVTFMTLVVTILVCWNGQKNDSLFSFYFVNISIIEYYFVSAKIKISKKVAPKNHFLLFGHVAMVD